MNIFGILVFLFQERTELAQWQQKHLANVTAAIKDALPIVERYRQSVAPNSDIVKHVESAMKKTTLPQPGDQDYPINPNPNVGA